jgi:hypothetical protein
MCGRGGGDGVWRHGSYLDDTSFLVLIHLKPLEKREALTGCA